MKKRTLVRPPRPRRVRTKKKKKKMQKSRARGPVDQHPRQHQARRADELASKERARAEDAEDRIRLLLAQIGG